MKSDRLWLAAITLVALAHYALICRMYPPVDDYYTFLRYTDNALAGHGLVFNPGGERVEGYTSFLYLVLLLGLRALHLSPIVCARMLNAVLFGLFPSCGLRLAHAMGIEGRRAFILPILLATNHALSIYACSAMESSLLVVLVLWALERFFCGRYAVCGLLLGAVVLTRPEGVLLGSVLACAALFDGRSPLRLLAGAAVVAPHLAWRRIYYGDWLPNSYYAKTGGPLFARVAEGLVGLHRLAVTAPAIVVVAAVVVWMLAPRSRAGTLLAALSALAAIVLLWEGVDDWLYWWHGSLLAAFSTLLAGHSLSLVVVSGITPSRFARGSAAMVLLGYVLLLGAGIVRHLSASFERVFILLCVLGILLLGARYARRAAFAALAVIVVLSLFRIVHPDSREVLHDITPTAFAVREIAKPNDTLATGAAGAIPYFSGLVTYDTLGINDAHIAHEPLPTLEYGGFAHHRGDGPYILAKRPTLIVAYYGLTPSPEPGPGFEKTFREMFQMPEFDRLYEFHAERTANGEYLNYYRLRESF